MARLLVRNVFNNRWLDSCKQPMYVRSPDNRTWIQIDPKKLWMRDGANSEFLENDCSYDPMFDDACAFMLLNSVNCPQGIPADELGSGDGTGSRGSVYDRINGYPPGYDLPDAGDSGFELVRDEATAKGWALKRPALNYVLESYDEGGTTPSYGRGNWANPNYLGSSTFSGGTQIAESIYDLGPVAGYVEVIFASYDTRGISVDVYYMGSRVATTCGFVSGKSKVEFYYDPALGEGEQRIMIRVRSSSDGTRWVYQTMGPKPQVLLGLDNTDNNQMLSLMTDEYNGTPLYPAPCHATVFPREYKTVDGKWFYEFHHVIDSLRADPNEIRQMVLDYTSWLNADKFEVYHGGLRIASTMDAQQDLGMLRFTWNAGRFTNTVNELMVRVTTSERQYGSDIMSWYYTLFCPDVIGYRAAPWPCDGAEIRSMGHSSTEDNFDLDNDVDPGVVSIKIVGFGNFEYVISVFDSNMDLIEAKVGTETTFVQFFVNTELHGNTRKRIAVRVDCPLGEYWEYFVGCPVPMLEVELDDKIIPVCNDEVEITVNDVNVPRGSDARFQVSLSVPKANPITVDFSTEDDTAISVGGSSGIGSTYGITENNISMLTVQEIGSGMLIVDAAYHRLLDDQYKQGKSSNFNRNNAVSSYSTLSADGKSLVNAWQRKRPNLNGAKWLILSGYGGSGNPTYWAPMAANFIQSMRNIYGMTVVLEGYDLSAGEELNANSWEDTLDLHSDADIITVVRQESYERDNGLSLAAVYSGQYSSTAQKLNNMLNNGAILHFVTYVEANLTVVQRSNVLMRELFNTRNDLRIQFDHTRLNTRSTPQYYVADHLQQLPGSPFTQNVDQTGLFDGDFVQAYVTYTAQQTATNPDYNAASGTLTIPAGQVAATVSVQTLTNTNPLGRQFYLNISNPSEGTIARNRGRATIVAPSQNQITDFNFTRTVFTGTSHNGAGAVVHIGIGYNRLEKNGTNTQEGGKVAFVIGDTQAGAIQWSRGICATYPFDPALTYTYRWTTTKTEDTLSRSSNILDGQVSLGSYGPGNSILFVEITQNHLPGGRAVFRCQAFITASNGVEYRSNEFSVVLIGHGSNTGGPGGPGGPIDLDPTFPEVER